MIWLIGATSKPRDPEGSTYYLEIKQQDDIQAALQAAEVQGDLDGLIKAQPDASGQEFWALCLRERLFESVILRRFRSFRSETDETPSWEDFLSGNVKEPWCSYTGPRADQVREATARKGTERVVLFCFNSRNWNNYPNHGVLATWSDGDRATYLTLEDMIETYGITAEEWADPAGKLFGKKAPFQYTYE
ncbi:MAG: hypothetical protein H6839_11680 [Planctomycetes bacterium]|nr:hypothetical protein [Planctomycetota bacterium]